MRAAAKPERQIAMLRQGKASCEEFFNGWDVSGSPSILMTLVGIALEATAATDCINKGDTPLLADIGKVCFLKLKR